MKTEELNKNNEKEFVLTLMPSTNMNKNQGTKKHMNSRSCNCDVSPTVLERKIIFICSDAQSIFNQII